MGGGGTLRTGSLGELLADPKLGRSFAGRGNNSSADDCQCLKVRLLNYQKVYLKRLSFENKKQKV